MSATARQQSSQILLAAADVVAQWEACRWAKETSDAIERLQAAFDGSFGSTQHMPAGWVLGNCFHKGAVCPPGWVDMPGCYPVFRRAKK